MTNFISIEEIKATEESLRNYYKELETVDHDKYILKRLKDRLECLKENKRTYKSIFIDPELNMGINMGSEKVQTSPTGTSYAEREFIRQETKLEKEITDAATEISKMETDISKREVDLSNVEYGIKDAIEHVKIYDVQDMVEWRYKKNMTYLEISEKLKVSDSAVERAFKRTHGIIDCIYKWTRRNKELKP